MFKLPEFPTMKLPKIDWSAIKNVDVPTLDWPAVDFSKLDIDALRNVKLPNLRDAAYMTVGLSVVAVERAQAGREQLTAAVTERIEQVRELIRTSV
ncbi:MAG: hypothetical protein ABI894_05130 [Ilumatobacteraceae bacterium]